jgi:hypothetical protein
MARRATATSDNIANANFLLTTIATPLTFATRFKLDSAGVGTRRALWRDGNQTGSYIEGTNVINWFVNATFMPTSVTTTTGVWYHFAATGTMNVTANWLLYVNGALDTTSSSAASIVTNNGLKFLGDNFSQSTMGTQEDMAWWNVQLTAPEIRALAFGARPGAIRPQNLWNWYPLDGYGAPARDLGIMKQNGVLSGTVFALSSPFITGAPIFPGVPAQSFMMPPPPPPFVLMPQILW